uniref:RING-type E3 ubiquitin transferase n=1 Tax=Rhizophora mucronata TaxID=61149 RepID=A0A2P2KB24_RHIMU
MALLSRKFKADVPSSVSKGAPDFCNVYVISKGKISSARNASRAAPFTSPVLHELDEQNGHSDNSSDTLSTHSMSIRGLFLSIIGTFSIFIIPILTRSPIFSPSFADRVSVKPRSSLDEPSKYVLNHLFITIK